MTIRRMASAPMTTRSRRMSGSVAGRCCCSRRATAEVRIGLLCPRDERGDAVAPGRPGRAEADRTIGVAAIPASTRASADLLSRAQRGVRKEDRGWNTKDAASGRVGHVLRFDVDATFVAQFDVHRVGGAGIDELWVPAERLDEFHAHIVGPIKLTASYVGDRTP